MPAAVQAITVIDDDGNYNVYLNARCGNQVEAYQHEIEHIRNDDFCSSQPIWVVEKSAG